MPSIRIGKKRITLAITNVPVRKKKKTVKQIKQGEESKLVFRLKLQGYTHGEMSKLTGLSQSRICVILRTEYGIKDIEQNVKRTSEYLKSHSKSSNE